MTMRKFTIPPCSSTAFAGRRDPLNHSDSRVNRLLDIFSGLEPHEQKMPEAQFSEFLEDAAVACGFADVMEACEALIGPNLLDLQRISESAKVLMMIIIEDLWKKTE